MRHLDRRRISRRDFFKAAGLTVATLAALGGGAYALQRWDDSQNAVSVADTGPGNDHREAAELKELTYKGKNYRQRPELETYLFMGIDTMGAAVGVNSYAGGGQADVQIVAVLDRANQTWQALQLNRDSIVRVPVLGVGGDIVAYEDEQLALAHYYGNGREQSCENTVLAVSMLLGDQPIDGYMAVNMDAVGILTDLVGGVTLTVTSDFPSAVEVSTSSSLIAFIDTPLSFSSFKIIFASSTLRLKRSNFVKRIISPFSDSFIICCKACLFFIE